MEIEQTTASFMLLFVSMFFFKGKKGKEKERGLVGSEICIRDNLFAQEI